MRVECPSTYTDADPALHLVYDSVLLNREASASDLRAVYEALRALAAAEPAVRGAERLRIRLVPR